MNKIKKIFSCSGLNGFYHPKVFFTYEKTNCEQISLLNNKRIEGENNLKKSTLYCFENKKVICPYCGKIFF